MTIYKPVGEVATAVTTVTKSKYKPFQCFQEWVSPCGALEIMSCGLMVMWAYSQTVAIPVQ